MAELRLLEAGLARHLQSVNDTLDKRRAAGKRWPGSARWHADEADLTEFLNMKRKRR